MLWRPDTLIDRVRLEPARPNDPTLVRFEPWMWPGTKIVCVDDSGTHLLVERAERTHRLWLPAGLPDPGIALAAIIELDEYAPQRTAAALAFWRDLVAPPPRRRAAQPRAVVIRGDAMRRVMMLRALDGHLAGASHRAIADELFGAERVATEAWRTSSLRAQAIRLIDLGLRLMRGGYRDLLKPPKPRRPA